MLHFSIFTSLTRAVTRQAIVVVAVAAWGAKFQAYAVLGVATVSLLLQVKFSPYDEGKGSTGASAKHSYASCVGRTNGGDLLSRAWAGWLSPNRLETASLSVICATFYTALFLFEAEAGSAGLVGRVTQHWHG